MRLLRTLFFGFGKTPVRFLPSERVEIAWRWNLYPFGCKKIMVAIAIISKQDANMITPEEVVITERLHKKIMVAVSLLPNFLNIWRLETLHRIISICEH